MLLLEAAKQGDLEKIKQLVLEGSNINTIDTENGYTALHYACANNHAHMITYLLNNSDYVFNRIIGNRYVGKIQITFNINPLMTAAMNGHVNIIDRLLNDGIYRVDEQDYVLLTALHFAAENGHYNCLQRLITAGANINSTSLIGNTPLSYASQNGHYECVELLIQNGADVNIFNKSNQSAMDLALKNDHDRIVALLLRANTQCLNTFVKLDHLVNEHPDLLFINASILKNCRSPITILNNLYSERYTRLSAAFERVPNESFVTTTIRKLLESQNRKIISYLVTFRSSLLYAAQANVTEEVDIKERITQLDKVLVELFRTEALDKMELVLQFLLPDLNFREYNEDEVIINMYSSDIDKQHIVKKHTEKQRLWLLLHAAYCISEDGGVLNDAIEKNFKILFQFSQVSGIINEVFYHAIIPPSEGLYEFRRSNFFYFDDTGITDMIFEIDKDKIVLFLNLRYCPIVNLYFEAFSKVITLALVWILSYYDFQPPGGIANKKYEGAPSSEFFFTIIVISSILYEFGQLQDEKWNFRDYFTLWNLFDVLSLLLMTTWVVIKYSNMNDSVTHFYIGFTALSVSAIPLSIVLLQYLSLFKEIGILIIIIRAMSYDAFIFLIVYICCTLGFAISFQALYYDYGYDKIMVSILNLYGQTLGTFNLENFLTPCIDSISICPPDWVIYIGIVLNCIFLGFSLVLLLNLLIAKFSNTYQKINETATAEWSYFIGKSLQQNIILKDRSPLCMLPPPFNTITIIVAPFQTAFIRAFGISLAGTIADWLFTIIGFMLAYVYISFHCFYKFSYGLSVYRVLYSRYKGKRVLYWWLVGSLFLILGTFISLIASMAYALNDTALSAVGADRTKVIAYEALYSMVAGSLFTLPCLLRSKLLLGRYCVRCQQDGTINGLEPNLSESSNTMFDSNDRNITVNMNPMIQEDSDSDRATRITSPEVDASVSDSNNNSDGFNIDAEVFLPEDLKRILSLLKTNTTDTDINKMLQQLNLIINDLNQRIRR